MRLFIGAMLALLVAACSGGEEGTPSTPQQTATPSEGVVLERGTECGTCGVILEPLAVLGSLSDSLSMGDAPFLVVTPAGCVVGPTDIDRELLVFKNCSGSPRQFGRAGDGPGELSSIRAIASWPGDSVVAFGYGKMTILSALTGAGRTVPIDRDTRGQHIVVLPGTPLLIVNNELPARARFTAINADGSHHQTFGMPPRADPRADKFSSRVVLGQAGAQEGLWTGATHYRYRLARRMVGGGTAFLVERTPRWFTAYGSAALKGFWDASAAVMRPLPYLRGIHEDAGGTLWVTAGVAAADWAPDSVKPVVRRNRAGEVTSKSSSRLEHYDGVIEALDAKTGTHLITVQTPDLWVGFANDTIVYSRRETVEGVPQLALYRIRLKRQ